MEQIKPFYRELFFSKVLANVNSNKTRGNPSKEDYEIGYELYYAVVFCPPAMVNKTYTFINQLLTNETSRTIIQTIVHLFHAGAITDRTSSLLTSQFYQVLASTFDLQYGNVLLATSTKDQLQAVVNNEGPFFTKNTDLVKCLQESNCERVQDIYQTLGT